MQKYKTMGFLYRLILRPLFFMLPPEFIHSIMLSLGSAIGRSRMVRLIFESILSYQNPSLKQVIDGCQFINPIGLAAGYDKEAQLLQLTPAIGFGFSTVGSITYKAYAGNQGVRLYRLKKSRGIVVNYGLKNQGVRVLSRKIKSLGNLETPLVVSIAKTNAPYTADLNSGIKDYVDCAQFLNEASIGDIYEINISCPNTFGGEPFTTPESLTMLLDAIEILKLNKPIWIKMPINLSDVEYDALMKVICMHQVRAVVIGNLNKNHNDVAVVDQIPAHVKGGISGKPTFSLSNELIFKTYAKYQDQVMIVGVGGIFSAADAYEKIKRGATLVELIAGMIYEGPQLIGQINHELVRLLKSDGYSSITEAIGAYHRING